MPGAHRNGPPCSPASSPSRLSPHTPPVAMSRSSSTPSGCRWRLRCVGTDRRRSALPPRPRRYWPCCPPTSSACATCWKRHIGCKLPHEEHQFCTTISETRFSRWRRPHAAGPRRLECSYGCGQHDKRNRVAAFQLSPSRRKHNLPDQLRADPRSDRNGIA